MTDKKRRDSKSELTFRFIEEKNIFEGPKGISFKYFSQTNDKKIKYYGKETAEGKFTLYSEVDSDKKEPAEFNTLADFIKKVKTVDVLEFAVKHLMKYKKSGQSRLLGRSVGSKKKGSKKGKSKKGSKKGKSKKGKSKKGSKKKGSKKKGSKK